MNENEKHEKPEEWTDTEQMLQGLVKSAIQGHVKGVSVYQWALGAVLAILMFVLGIQYQGERLSSIVIKTESRVSAVEDDIRELKNGILWLKDNAATKADIERLRK